MSLENQEIIAGEIADAITGGKDVLNLKECRKMMELDGIPFNKSGLATSVDEALTMVKDIPYPVVMKIVSPQVIHKTEVGGVKVNINTDEELRKAYDDIISGTKEKVPDAEIKGILIEEMVKGPELIIGTTEDPQFGPMIMFGIGGIFVEVYKDVSFRLIPISPGDARDMLSEIRGKALLEGVRGLPGADTEELVNILLTISEFVDKNPQVKEMDLNPLIATERGVLAVDARIILEKKPDVKDTIKSIRTSLEQS
jgi:acyl-CoA synthetase (NDP forming)